MRLLRLDLTDVRGVASRSLTFSTPEDTSGVVIVEGTNEAGKSTLGDVLDILLECKDSSRNKDVKSLQTEGVDRAPEVEAELRVGVYHFVYRKRFLRQTSTELRILAPTPRTLTGEEAHAWVEQTLTTELDTDLWSSLRLRQGEGVQQVGPGGMPGLAAAIAGNGDATAIGDRELQILHLVELEHDRYFTRKTGAAKPVRKSAEAEVADLTEGLARIDERRAALTEDIDRVDRLQRSLPDLREQVETSRARAAELAEQLAEIQALARRVEECEADERDADERLARAREERERRTALVAELAAAEDEQKGLAGSRADAEDAERAAAARLEEATAAHEAARTTQQQARSRRQRTQRDLDHVRDADELSALRDRADRAEAATARLREAEAEAAGSTIDEPLLEELQAAERALIHARAALDAASPALRLTAVRDLALHTDGDPVELGEGETREWTVNGTLALRIPDVGEVVVDAGGGIDDVAEDERRATRRVAEALARAGVADLAEAERAFRRRREAEAEAATARREREAALEGRTTDALADEIARLDQQVTAYAVERPDDEPLCADATAASAALDAATEEERAADESLAEPEAAMERARAELERRRHAAVQQTVLAETTARRVRSLREELEAARGKRPDADLDADATAADEACGRARAALEAARDALAGADPDTITSRAANASQVADDASARLRQAEQELNDARVRIAALGGDGLWEQRQEREAELAHAQTALVGLERRAMAARTLLEVLEEQRDLARDRYAAPLQDKLLTYGRMLYGPDFDIELDEDLRVARRKLDDLWLDVGQLSIGAKEQLALLGRLACATLLGEQGGLLLFDDALGNTDPERLEHLGAVLRRAGEHCQIVVLTCYPDRYRHVGGATRLTL